MRLISKLLAGAVLFIASQSMAGPYSDPIYGFSVTTPDNWPTEAVSDGEDRALKIQSPDGNAYGEVRAIHLARGTTIDHLIEAFRSSVVPNGTLAGSADETYAGLSGKVVAWRANISGQNLVLGGFFAVDGPVGYILLSITAEAQFGTYSPQLDKIFDTFRRGTLITAYQGEAQPDKPALPPSTKPRMPGGTPDIDRTGTAMHEGLVAEPHPELGYVFTRYDAWHPDMPAPYMLRVGLMEYPPEMRPSIVIEALAGEAYASLEAGAEDLRAQLRDYPDARFDQDGPHEVPNMAENGTPMPGWSFGAAYSVNGVPFRQLTFLFKRAEPSVYYAIYVTGPQDILMQHQPEMMRMLQAIQIIPFSQ